jgi:hypothetical protein
MTVPVLRLASLAAAPDLHVTQALIAGYLRSALVFDRALKQAGQPMARWQDKRERRRACTVSSDRSVFLREKQANQRFGAALDACATISK